MLRAALGAEISFAPGRKKRSAMSEPNDTGDGDESRVREQSRLLKERIARAQGLRNAAEGRNPEQTAAQNMSGLGRAFRLGTEFIAAILVGAVVGYLLDQWLHTSPWIMLVMLLVGFAAGVLNVARAAAEMNKAAPVPPGSDLGPGEDDE
jgi:ATP synthase protein I